MRETEDEAWAVEQGFLAKSGADRTAASVDQQSRTQLGTPGGLADASSENPTVQRLMWSGPVDWSPPDLVEIFDFSGALGKYLVGSATQVAKNRGAD